VDTAVTDPVVGAVLEGRYRLEERVARDVIPRLKAARAAGIVEYPLNKVVL